MSGGSPVITDNGIVMADDVIFRTIPFTQWGSNQTITSLIVGFDSNLIVLPLQLWETSTGMVLTTFSHDDQVSCCALSTSGKFIVSCSEDNTVKVSDGGRRSGGRGQEGGVRRGGEAGSELEKVGMGSGGRGAESEAVQWGGVRW